MFEMSILLICPGAYVFFFSKEQGLKWCSRQSIIPSCNKVGGGRCILN